MLTTKGATRENMDNSPETDSNVIVPNVQKAVSKRQRQDPARGGNSVDVASDSASHVEELQQALVQPNTAGRYNLRAQTIGRHPGLHPGLDWENNKREQELADAKKARQKIANLMKKITKMQANELEELGVLNMAALESNREKEDLAEDAYMRVGAAHAGKRDKSYVVGEDRDSDSAESVSEYVERTSDGEDGSSGSSQGQNVETPTNVTAGKGKKVSFKSFNIASSHTIRAICDQRALTAKERKNNKHIDVLARIDGARQVNASTQHNLDDKCVKYQDSFSHTLTVTQAGHLSHRYHH